ncbi:MBL fold metallo-hydrolase [Virgibacillus ainsalahensis]
MVKKETPVIYPITVPTSSSLQSFNFYLVENQDTLMLVDAGVDTGKCWDYFLDTLQDNGLHISDIDKIVLTHSHQDHTGLVNRILDVHDIPVYAHADARIRLRRDEGFLKRRVDFFQALYFKMGCGEKGDKQAAVLKRKAKENKSQAILAEILPLHEESSIAGFDVIETPGHWPDHIVLFHPESKILIGGDHILQHISSNALIEPTEQGTKGMSLVEYEKALKRVQAYEASLIYPGHGEVVQEPNQLIQKRLQGIERKSRKLNDCISRIHPCTTAQVALEYYKEIYETEFSLVMSEVFGHLERLELLGTIWKKELEGKWYYSSVNH